MTHYRIVLHRSSEFVGPRRGWWWALKSDGNGKTLAHSELYSARSKAFKTADALAKALDIEVVESR